MKSLIFLIITFFGVNISNAQIVDRTEDRAKQKANQRVDQKIDQGLDKGLDAIEGLFGKKKKNKSDNDDDSDQTENESATELEEPNQDIEAQSDMMSKMFSGSNVDIQDSYSFDHNILMNIQSIDKKGKAGDVTKMTMYFSEETPYFGMSMEMEGTNNFIIYDMKTYEMVSLIDNGGQKMGMTMKLNPENFMDDKDSERTMENASFEKTGNTKTISGYNCIEYKLIDPDSDPGSTSTFWMTTDIDANWMEMMSTIASTNKKMQNNYVLPGSYPDGSMIQIVNTSTKNGEQTITTVEKINKDDQMEVATSGYQFMSLPGSR